MKKKSGPLIDEAAHEQLKELPGDKSATLLEDLLELFLDTAPKSLVLMQDAIETNDSALLESEAHKLKSTCGSLGAYSLKDFCQAFESYGATQQIKKAGSDLKDFEAEFQAVMKAIRDIQRKHRRAA